MKRAQVISLDFISGTVLFLLFVAAFFALAQTIQTQDVREEDEYLFAHTNFEQNLALTETPFYSKYRIDADTLQDYSDAPGDINELIYGNSATQGIGLSPEGHNSCVQIVNSSATLHEFGSCELLEFCNTAVSVTKPAIYDTQNYEDNQIVQVRIVTCRK